MEARRAIGRLRRREIDPPYPDVTHEEFANFLERCLEQDDLVRDVRWDMKTYRELCRDLDDRQAREMARRDVEAFHALKVQASAYGGSEQLVRELHRARRAAGGRARGRRG